MKQHIRIDKLTPNMGILDFSHLLDAPAGKHGFVQVKDGHLAFEDGKRVRFLGFNIAARSNTPDHATAEKLAARFASLGVNVIRLHAADAPIGDEPRSWSSCREAPLLDYEKGTSRLFNPEGLDRFDYLIAQLKARGIYLHIDLIVARPFLEGDGLDYPGSVPSCMKRYPMYNPRLIELQKEYARELLCHVNPYTGLALKDDPAVMTVQINNEESAIKGNSGSDQGENMRPYDPRDKGSLSVNREAADPSLVLFRDRYYLFASMTGSVWVSDDLAHWESHRLPEKLPIYDYAPDVRVIGDWLCFTASNRGVPCDFFRTKDPVHGPWERIPGTFDFWDPNMFLDDDGRLYFYWGCSNSTPIRGVELDQETMRPIGESVPLITGDPWQRGYERFGENHCESPRTEKEIDRLFGAFLKECERNGSMPPPENHAMIRATFAGMPYIEGAWMTKHEGRYYLQYACPGAEINVYADGVYVSDHPLGPFTPAENNPYSYHPGGFLPGAGHGSTLQDREGAYWHTSTMRISVNHIFERRVGIWLAGFDQEGSLFCNQRYGDWPMDTEKLRSDPWADPDWMLLSYGKAVSATSCDSSHPAENAVDENVQTWWRAASSKPGQELTVDLGETMDVHAVQVNFADDPEAEIPCPAELVSGPDMPRYIDLTEHHTRWLLEASSDDVRWETLADKREADTDLSHDLVVIESGIRARYIRLTVTEVPFHVPPCVSGLRIFGMGNEKKPGQIAFTARRIGDLDFTVSAESADAMGFNILWGSDEQHLYHSWLVMGSSLREKRIGALVKGQAYTVRVDAVNENGITKGKAVQLE